MMENIVIFILGMNAGIGLLYIISNICREEIKRIIMREGNK